MDFRFWAFEHCMEQKKCSNPQEWELQPGRFTSLPDVAQAAASFLFTQAEQDQFPAVKLVPIE